MFGGNAALRETHQRHWTLNKAKFTACLALHLLNMAITFNSQMLTANILLCSFIQRTKYNRDLNIFEFKFRRSSNYLWPNLVCKTNTIIIIKKILQWFETSNVISKKQVLAIIWVWLWWYCKGLENQVWTTRKVFWNCDFNLWFHYRKRRHFLNCPNVLFSKCTRKSLVTLEYLPASQFVLQPVIKHRETNIIQVFFYFSIWYSIV